MQLRWVGEVLRTKKLRTVTGLIFYWPDTTVTSSGYVTNTPSIFNYQIQMFATADIAPIGAVLLWHQLKAAGLQSFIINVVHDSVVLEEHPDETEIVGNFVTQCLSKDIVGIFKSIINFDINYPLDVDTRSSTHWDWDDENDAAANTA